MKNKPDQKQLTAWMLLSAFMLLLGGSASAAQLHLEAGLGKTVMLAEKKGRNYLKVGLTGFEMADAKKRAAVNVAIVLDKSGSMQGEKLQKAKEAAKMVIGRLDARDIVSILAYDDTVEVLVPATRLTDKKDVLKRIDRMKTGGSTALFAGVSKGAAEIRKFFSRDMVNRLVLLSDGLANVGPQSANELGELGASLKKEGISVTTLGLGMSYNEDLMVALAEKSNGNHGFVEQASDLARFFNYEFGDVLSVVAQEVVIEIECAKGVRPVRTLGRTSEIKGQTVVLTLNQIYAKQEKYLILEVELTGGKVDVSREVASVKVSYANMETKTAERLSSSVNVRFSNSKEVIEKNRNRKVMIGAILQIAAENSKLAVRLRDDGKVLMAKKTLLDNAAFCADNGVLYRSNELKEMFGSNWKDAQNLDEKSWGKQRKLMRKYQVRKNLQLSW